MSENIGSEEKLLVELEQKHSTGSINLEKPQKQDLVSAEIKGLARHLNNELVSDSLARPYLPIEIDAVDLLDKISDGVLHCAFIRCISPDSVAAHKIITPEHKGRPLNTFEMQANQRLYIEAAISLGLVVVNIGENDLIHSRQHVSLVLGLLWQLLDRQLRQRTGLQRTPRQKPTLDEHKQLVLEWINKRLPSDGSVIVNNFTTDLKDGRAYLLLLKSICPTSIIVSKPNHFNDDLSRAQAVISISTKMGLVPLIESHDIVSGHEQLNYVFMQSLVAWCHMKQNGSKTDTEIQAPVSVDAIEKTLNKNVSYDEQLTMNHLSRFHLLFYLGMQRYIIQIDRLLSSWWALRSLCSVKESKIQLQTQMHKWNFWRWLQLNLTIRRSSRVSFLTNIHREQYWSVALLPGLESLGVLFTHSQIYDHRNDLNVISALTAAALGRTVVAPLETMQIRKQVNSLSVAGSFRGHSANLGRLLPYTIIQFLSCNHQEIAQGQYSSLILATSLATLLTYPLDVVQTQMAASTTVGSVPQYMWKSIRNHGLVPGLYRGILPHSLGATAFISMHLATVSHFNDVFQPEFGGLISFISSLIATYPARTIGRRMQMGLLQKSPPLQSMSNIIHSCVQREGLQGFYKGIVPAIAKTASVYVCTAATFHFMHRS